jgi:succinate dehydrogenase flavin-adding protein (antitoxin of CptAB toxin-antitoxin module)
LATLLDCDDPKIVLLLFHEDPVTEETLADYAHRVSDLEG